MWKIFGDAWLNLNGAGRPAHWVRTSSIQQIIELASFDENEDGSKLILIGGASIETKTPVKTIMDAITNANKEESD